jgi:signal peptidase I
MILLFIPIVNIFVIAAMASDLNKTFSRFSFLDSILAIALPFVWFPYMGFVLKDKLVYIGPASALKKEFKKNYKAAAKEKNELYESGQTQSYLLFLQPILFVCS